MKLPIDLQASYQGFELALGNVRCEDTVLTLHAEFQQIG